ncbi:hypothetical protein ABBQ38_014371 [Trebouxia sp. C0009 RCD-2024]
MSEQWDQFAREGWHIKEEVKQSLVEGAQQQSVQVLELLLNTDLRKFGAPQLPDDINRIDSSSLKGGHVLQITNCEDVSKPSKGVGTSTHRLLRLKLTDGKLSCIAAEFKSVPQLHEELPPGTKVLLTNASVKLGVVLLDARNIQVLGGQVEELVEAWTFQRKFGNVQRSNTNSEDTKQPPAFQNFIPGRRHNQAGHRAPPQQAAYPKTEPPADQGQSAGLAASVSRAGPSNAAPGTAGRPHQPSSSASAVGLPPGLGLPPQAQQAGAANYGMNGNSSEAQAVGRDAAEGATGSVEGQGKGQQPQQRRPQQAVGQVQHNQAAVKQKLLERLADDGGRDRGRGRGRGRRGRRGYDDEEDSGMTLDEYEAMQRRPKPSMVAVAHPLEQQYEPGSDEAFARQLQQQLDMEDGYAQHHRDQDAGAAREGGAPHRTPATHVAQDLAHSLFAFDRPQEDEGGRGRGRGRGRGDRRGGRGRGRP